METHIEQKVRARAAVSGNRTVFRYKATDGATRDIGWPELVSVSDRVSRALLSLGQGAFARIGICSENRPEWTLADLGILAVRGIVVPFFPSATAIQLQPLVDETEMQVLFLGNDGLIPLATRLLDHCASLKTVIVFEPGPDPGDPHFMRWDAFLRMGEGPEQQASLVSLRESASEEDLATVIYTSGTTGTPKGVMLDHRSFLSSFRNHDLRLELGESDVSLCFLPLSHIFERAWTYYLMVRGAVNVYLENPRKVIDTLKEVRPTVMCTVPRFFDKTHEGIFAEYRKWSPAKQRIFDWSIRTGMERIRFESEGRTLPFPLWMKDHLANLLVYRKLQHIFGGRIRYMPCAGAAIKKEILQFFHAARLFINYGYGCTETTATVSCFRNDRYDFYTCGSVMPGVSVAIGPGEEILIKGETVFRGYYRKPEETARALKDGWYHSGDKGYLTGEDYLVMTDRIKDIFKTSGGKYISPQSIELLAGQISFVEQVMVIGDNRKYVTALIVPNLEHLRSLAAEWGLGGLSDQELVSHTRIIEYVEGELERVGVDLSPFERIIRFTLLTEPFTVDNNLMTSTLKVKRQQVIRHYQEVIDAMYHDTTH